MHGLGGDVREAISYYDDPHESTGRFDFVLPPTRLLKSSGDSLEMIDVSVGEETKDLRDVRNSWLRGAIEGQRHSGEAVCIKVILTLGNVDMILATPGCPSSGFRKEEATAEELRIIEAWRSKGLNKDHFAIHHLIEFLKLLETYL